MFFSDYPVDTSAQRTADRKRFRQILLRAGIDPDSERELWRTIDTAHRSSDAWLCALEILQQRRTLSRLSVNRFKRMCESTSWDERNAGFVVIQRALGRSAIKFFQQLATRPGARHWLLFSSVLWHGGNEADAPAAFDILKATYARQPRFGYSGWDGPATTLLRFLDQYRNSAVAKEAFEWSIRNWRRFTNADHAAVPRAIPALRQFGPDRWIAFIGRPALLNLRLLNALVEHDRLCVLPVDLSHRKCSLHARRAAEHAQGIICLEHSVLSHPAIQRAGFRCSEPPLVLETPKSVLAPYDRELFERIGEQHMKRINEYSRRLKSTKRSGP